MSKITNDHLSRFAFVYIRQSTMSQVHHNLESKRRQYGLQDLAAQYGWTKITVIDDDLGRSGSGTQHRQGFEKLITEVCTGNVGAIFALEASRLARNGFEWHRLLELCGLFKTLIIDHDGVYDSHHPNDRLLLGMKGTVSELEVSTFRQRSQEAIRQKARRGEHYTLLPIGYKRREDGVLMKDPDLRIQQSISLVLHKFEELGSARQVFLWFHRKEIELPKRVCQGGRCTVGYRLPTARVILGIISNPIYAGAYVYGRTKRKIIFKNGVKQTVSTTCSREQWEVLIQNHHEGYIDWNAYEKNQRILAHNANMKGEMVKGSVRKGVALLAGILRCAHCGCKLQVSYYGKESQFVRYSCKRPFPTGEMRTCSGFAGTEADQVVSEAVLATIAPLGIEAAIKAAEITAAKTNDVEQQRLLELEQARYEAHRCERQFAAVEPENRLVAATLERRWNEALEKVAEVERRLQLTSSADSSLAPGEHERLLQLGHDVSLAWNHPEAPHQLRKRILRTVLKEIIVRLEEASVDLLLHWQGGQHTKLSVRRFRTGFHRWNSNTDLVMLVQNLARVMSDNDIAMLLNRLGTKTAKGHSWIGQRVGNYRTNYNIAVYRRGEEQERGELKVAQLAERFKVSYMTILRAIQKKIIPATQACPGAPWIISADAVRNLTQTDLLTLTKRKLPSPEDKNQINLNF